ncbi:DUF6083 domain-containing protein [Streptomyces sp. NPDC057136]|uniref:DUF6083 domain-containing protein n=1 Tax=Streptomyces sp. NPDC057136 TaxID=3346029 RepID=UPI0036387AD3
MGDAENTENRPDHLTHTFRSPLEGTTAPRPPAPPDCPYCDLPQDRYSTHYADHWVLLEPRILVPAHTLPPRRRWIITPDGAAMNLWDAEPLPGTLCRIPHRIACPCLPSEDHWRWVSALRQYNGQRAQRLFNLPDEGFTDTG